MRLLLVCLYMNTLCLSVVCTVSCVYAGMPAGTASSALLPIEVGDTELQQLSPLKLFDLV